MFLIEFLKRYFKQIFGFLAKEYTLMPDALGGLCHSTFTTLILKHGSRKINADVNY